MAASVELTGFTQRSNGRYSSAPDAPLRAAYFIPAKMPMSLVYPRPDGETPAHARHRNFHSQMTYSIPVGIQGGAWPFEYEILSSPVGATIGQYYGTTNYGVISWTPAGQTGSQSFTVRVTDCDGNILDVTWTASLNDAQFVFVQDGYAGTKVGTITQPLEDIPDWYLNSHTDATYANKIIVFRGGTYNATGNNAANPTNIELSTPYKTPSLISFPNETAIWNMTNAKIYDNSGIDDLFVSGIVFDGYRTDVTDAHHFRFENNSNRGTWHRCQFKNIGAGTAGTDNANPIYFGDAVNQKSYFYLADCTFDAVNNSLGNNGGFVDIYRADHIVYERNIAKNCTTNYGFWVKTSRSFISVRGNIAIENNNGSMITLSMGVSTGGTPHNIEINYNAIAVPSGQSSESLIIVNDTDHQGVYYNIFLYRNSVFGGTARVPGFEGLEPIETDANIIATNNTALWDLTEQTTTVSNYVTTVAAAIIDDQCELLGATGFATHGWRPY